MIVVLCKQDSTGFLVHVHYFATSDSERKKKITLIDIIVITF